jgi:hypothetical protein
MATGQSGSLKHHFAGLIDPRGERSRLHELLDVVGIALCAVIAGAESWPAVEAYGHAKRDWLARHFRLTNGIPSAVHSASPQNRTSQSMFLSITRIDRGVYGSTLFSRTRVIARASADGIAIVLDPRVSRRVNGPAGRMIGAYRIRGYENR